jgi:tRNA(Arg) A34 adenosine deaminase TadA
MKSEHDQFMALAIEEARIGMNAGDRPFGSVVVRDGKVVGRGRNLVASTLDPTAHAEVQAIRNAAANLKAARLEGCTLYTSCEPCPMCCGATFYAGIDTLVIGTRLTTINRLTKGLYDLRDYSVERLVELTGLKLKVVRDVMSEECDAMYRDWQGWTTYRMGEGTHGKAG